MTFTEILEAQILMLRTRLRAVEELRDLYQAHTPIISDISEMTPEIITEIRTAAPSKAAPKKRKNYKTKEWISRIRKIFKEHNNRSFTASEILELLEKKGFHLHHEELEARSHYIGNLMSRNRDTIFERGTNGYGYHLIGN